MQFKEDLGNALVELYKITSNVLPSDVISALKKAQETEKGNSKLFIDFILQNIEIAKQESRPICQDTGFPFFIVYCPKGESTKELAEIIHSSSEKATANFLRPNSVNPISEKNIGNIPEIHFREWDKNYLQFDLMLKGAGSENVSFQYSLPDISLNAHRDFEGVFKCALDAVFRAQGNGCPPGILGLCIGGSKNNSMLEAKKQLFRKIDDVNSDKRLALLEKNILSKSNKLKIGPAGLGGKNTLLAVKATVLPRHPASYFVSFSYSCWALRRHSLRFKEGVIKFD
ncbi:MAG: fumarate hydratase [archaeon]